MISGVKLEAYLTQKQNLILSQWMGCARLTTYGNSLL
ncbi:helix-turn-helix domain-containing protein (plasmid) [Acinetobacter sp. A1-4-2]|uniref:Helix-turn-helix domain-containing protein n=1 Tax=Acinetobacter sp. A1-4-2 TaxID=3156489 RepID=A0AAU7T1G5_9GAMM